MTNAPIAAANPLLAAGSAEEVRAMAGILPKMPSCGVYRTRDPRVVRPWRIAHYEVLRFMKFVDSIPKTVNGFVQRLPKWTRDAS